MCGEPIAGEPCVGFPPFVLNLADEWAYLGDAVVHQRCFEALDRVQEISAAVDAVVAMHGRDCAACGARIVDPAGAFFTGLLSSRPEDAGLNFVSLHAEHFEQWRTMFPALSRRLQELVGSSHWRGPELELGPTGASWVMPVRSGRRSVLPHPSRGT